MIPHPRVRVIWLIYLLGCLLLFWMALPMARRMANGEKYTPTYTGHRVLGTYWASGDAANRGLDPYSPQPLTLRVPVPSLGIRMLDPNLNPPITLPLFQALAHLPIATAAYGWMGASYLLFVLSGGILIAAHPAMQKRQAIWIVLSGPVFATLALGHIYAPLLLLAVLMWMALRRGRVTAAALCLAAVVSLRPIFLLWPVFLALRGHRRLAWQSLAFVVALSLLPVVVYGPVIYIEWLHAIGHDQHYVFFTDIALSALGHRFGYPRIGWTLSALTGTVCAIIAARRRRTPIQMLSILSACLCAPLSWTLYLMLTYPWMVERRWNWRRGTAALLLLIPDAVFFVMRATPGPRWFPVLGSTIATSIPLLLLADTWLEPRSTASPHELLSYS
jgi:hypothetical protein